ncbi:thiolase family protein [Herpetosiphon sp. NSE202]|uniref:thiolase family protein n=1 Tax=Herpetosiphon sp. NSE202 TaxID=3351349 RepID=UPI00363A9F0E
MAEAVLIDAVRTPIGRQQGSLRDVRPDVLYAHVLNALIERTGIDPSLIEDVVTGCVTNTGEQGANIGRLGVMLSNLPITVPAVTLNRMCGSAQQAIHFGSQAVAAGDANYVIAGGVESMSRVPMFSDVTGDFATFNPAINEKHQLVHQGESAELIAEKYQLSRTELDDWSFESHQRAAAATKAGWFSSQIAPIVGSDKAGNAHELIYDEGIRFEADRAKMGTLRTVFRADGVVTAANASQISDGAAVVLIGEREQALADGFKPRAKFRARVVAAGDPRMQLLEVIPATHKALAKAGLSINDIDLVEINEAFASVVLAWLREFKLDPNRVNPNGGAIAHGHPLGATGAVLMSKMLNELERRDAQFGLQVMCIGHGQATATIIERV